MMAQDHDEPPRRIIRREEEAEEGRHEPYSRAPPVSNENIMKPFALAAWASFKLSLISVILLAACSARQVAGQQQLERATGEKPKLIPLVAADSGYGENSSVNILCTVSQGHHESLQFDWFKDGQLIESPASPTSLGELDGAWTSGQPTSAPQIEKHSDHSLLRISRVQANAHSGRYTCAAKNQFGQDSSSVNLLVNVKLQWIKEPAREVVVSLNQELKVDCQANGEPRPTMRWEKLDALASQAGSIMQPRRGQTSNQISAGNNIGSSGSSSNNKHRQQQQSGLATDQLGYQTQADSAQPLRGNQLASSGNAAGSAGYKSAHGHHQRGGPLVVSSTGQLAIQRVRESDSGIYECIASNSRDADLRKLVHVQVRGPPKILPIATADSYPEGSSINLICTVSGGQRRGLTLSWTINGQPLDDQRLRGFAGDGRDEAFANNLAINTDDADISILKIKNATLKNSGHYTCTANNPLGQDSTSVDININVELKWVKTPKDKVEVGLGQQVSLECEATGSPQPTVGWLKHSSDKSNTNVASKDKDNDAHFMHKGQLLKIQKAQHADSGLYECAAKNGAGPDLRRFVQLVVRGK